MDAKFLAMMSEETFSDDVMYYILCYTDKKEKHITDTLSSHTFQNKAPQMYAICRWYVPSFPLRIHIKNCHELQTHSHL